MGRYRTTSPKETEALGRRLGRTLHGGELVAFTGGLGAGKTTFCRGLAAGLGCTDEAASPTFAIVNVYRGPVPLAHFDFYRLAAPDDLEAAGFHDYLDSGAVVAVEWSERFPLPEFDSSIKVSIAPLPGQERDITIEGAEGL